MNVLSKMVSPLQGINWLVDLCQSSRLEPNSWPFVSPASPGASGTVLSTSLWGVTTIQVKSQGVRRAWGLGLGERGFERRKREGASMRAGEGGCRAQRSPQRKDSTPFSQKSSQLCHGCVTMAGPLPSLGLDFRTWEERLLDWGPNRLIQRRSGRTVPGRWVS